METYRQNDRMTVMQRGGPDGVTVVIVEGPDGTRPRWTISYFPAMRRSRRPAFTDSSDTAPIPEELGDVLKWAKRRWDSLVDERRSRVAA